MPPTIKLRLKARQPAASFSILKLQLLEWESKCKRQLRRRLYRLCPPEYNNKSGIEV